MAYSVRIPKRTSLIIYFTAYISLLIAIRISFPHVTAFQKAVTCNMRDCFTSHIYHVASN